MAEHARIMYPGTPFSLLLARTNGLQSTHFSEHKISLLRDYTRLLLLQMVQTLAFFQLYAFTSSFPIYIYPPLLLYSQDVSLLFRGR